MKKQFIYKQLNIEKALKGKEEVFETPDKLEDFFGFKKLSLFDFVNDIRKYKKGNLLEDESNINLFNSFMILKTLSMKEDDVFICNYINKYSSILTKEQVYKALLYLIEKDNSFYKFITNKEKEDVDIKNISNYYDCSEKEAKQYKELFGQKWATNITNKYSMKEG
jgi:hypothetical protein